MSEKEQAVNSTTTSKPKHVKVTVTLPIVTLPDGRPYVLVSASQCDTGTRHDTEGGGS